MPIKYLRAFCLPILVFVIAPQKVEAQFANARWITAFQNQNTTNTWIAFRKDINVVKPTKQALAKIAADSKYWLYVNGKMVVFEGGLKRGPNPNDTYFDEIDIAPYLTTGKNTIAILLCYFGKDGFSHKSSGKAALLFRCQINDITLLSDKSWKAAIDAAWQTCAYPLPNFRLPESDILYDANFAHEDWQQPGSDTRWMEGAKELGAPGITPWNKLVPRPIPFWKNGGLKNYIKTAVHHDRVNHLDTLIGYLPYDAQITPFIALNATSINHILIFTDNYSTYNGGAQNLRAEYITKQGAQGYESLGWLNGNKVYYVVPEGAKVDSIKYRETGYNTEFEGGFSCSDTLLNHLWAKAARTLYLNMRDNFMDCPDRERAQWAGDAVIESGQSFYALSRTSDLLTKKWLHEITGWQRADGSMISPVPEGNYDTELPDQILSATGYYSVWNYYLNTGDKKTIKDLYPAIKKYLALWKVDRTGTVALRKGDWNWGDWGENKDMLLIYNLWYYLAVKSQYNIASALKLSRDANDYNLFMARFKKGFNKLYWNDSLKAYRDPAYKGQTDDRVQALAIVSGIADSAKFSGLLNVFQNEMHASPYMEKYVFEAMVQTGKTDAAIKRHTLRFRDMVNDSNFSTLFEGWGIGKEGFGGGTINHAWSGGGLTVLSKMICGIAPTAPGYKAFQIFPAPGSLQEATVIVPSLQGKIFSAFKNTSAFFQLHCEIPQGTKATIGIPVKNYTAITLNGTMIWKAGSTLKLAKRHMLYQSEGYFKIIVTEGKYTLKGILHDQ